MSETRTIKLLRLGADQVIEIPADMELPEGEATIVREGDRLIIASRQSSKEPIEIDPGSAPS